MHNFGLNKSLSITEASNFLLVGPDTAECSMMINDFLCVYSCVMEASVTQKDYTNEGKTQDIIMW